ncbi:CPBP family intramembrane metalloprotease [Flavobacteriaceae bacterium KMM 6898]|nr:CPBP family intramembrane metalloprotease [Flavobacteriaceae bacterium KMM 6898]
MNKIENKNQGWQRVLLIILPFILISGLSQLIGGLISGVDFSDPNVNKTSIQNLVVNFFNMLGILLVLWVFMKFVDKEIFLNLGFHTKNRLLEFIVGIGIGLLIMIVGYSILILLEEITFHNIIFDFKEIIISFLLFTFVSIAEETLFRGYILKNLMISFNKYIALIVSSLLFAVLHGFNPGIDILSLFYLFLAGILLGLSYIYTKNLWFPIGLHLSWNLFQALIGFNVSGRDSYSIIEFKMDKNTLINGGDFGFEGSVLSIFAQIIIIIGITIYYNPRKTNHNKA